MSDTIQIPIVVGYAFTMLFYILGLSFFSGIAVFVFAFVSNLGVGLILEKQQKEIMRRKDRRMNHCTEAIGNIKTLKLYSWTDVFQDEIQERRVFEFKKMKTIAIWLTFIIASLYFFP
jgi:ATP-binding cassette subfamily C (CFTR/MRP) protein 1